ncbi:MAG: hypothetical protein WCP57_02135 [Bacteroidota bacterium]
MKQKFTILFVLFIIAQISKAQNNTSLLISSWQVQSYQIFENENTSTPMHKISSDMDKMIAQKSNFTFNADKTFVKPDNSSIKYTYQVKENQIILSNSNTSDIEILSYKLIGDKLLVKFKLNALNEYIEITAVKI